MRRSVRTASFWWWISCCAVAACFAAAAGILIVAPEAFLDRGDQIASILACLVGCGSLALSVVGFRRAARAAAAPEADDDAVLDRAAHRLADVLQHQWAEEADARLVLSPHPLRVTWSSTGRPVSAAPEEIIGSVVAGRPLKLRLAGDVTEVAGTFRQLPAHQLVVLGEPGAGKSVLALLLTLDLLRDRTVETAVPVLFSASSWIERDRLDHWLVRRLAEDYPALRDDPAVGVGGLRRLLDSGRLLPVIDGLDEIDVRHHAAVLRMVHGFGAAGRPFVLTCRSAEFEAAVLEAGTPLARAAVVELEPVTGDQARKYLPAGQIDGARRWESVLDTLAAEPHGALAQTLSSPLMVYLARTAYSHTRADPAELCDGPVAGSRQLVERHLFDSYLPAVYAHAPRPYPADQAARWLSFLAGFLHRQQARDLAWWELPAAIRGWRFVAAGYGAVAAVIGVGLPVLFAAGVPQAALAAGIGGVTVGLLVLLTVERENRALLSLPHSGWRRRMIRAVRYGIIMGLPSMLFAGVAVAIIGSAWTSVLVLVPCLYLGAFTGLVAGRVRGQAPQAEDPSTITPRSVLRNDRRATIATIGSVVFASCVSTGLAARLVHQHAASAATTQLAVGAVGLLIGTVTGLVVAVFANPRSSWLSYVAARCYLAVRGHLPWRLMRFLANAHERGVLRQAGAVYQFRHVRLQDYLATRGTTPAPSRATPE
jgi:hypothetical protein